MRKYTKKHLKKSLVYQNSKKQTFTIALLLIIVSPVILIALFYTFFMDIYSYSHRRLQISIIALFLFISYSIMRKKINKFLDVHLYRVIEDETLILGNFKFNEDFVKYVICENEILPLKHKYFIISDLFLKDNGIFKNPKLKGNLIKVNVAYLKNSKAIVEVFDFIFMEESPLYLFNIVNNNIFLEKSYKSEKELDAVYLQYLRKVEKIYPGTKITFVKETGVNGFHHIKGITNHLNNNPKPFLEFILGADYLAPKCYKCSVQGEPLGSYQLTASEFAKILYFNLLEAEKYGKSLITSGLAFYSYEDRLG